MLRRWLWAAQAIILVYQTKSHPVDSDTISNFSFTAKTERSWLWGWAWGAESTVSVVDRSPVVSFPSRPAAFGAEIHDPILGYVIPLSSFTQPCVGNDSLFPEENSGCPDLCISGPNKPTETWIALVQRGKCEFVKKVREAQRLGARAVVVGGDNPDISGYPDTLVNMYSPEDSSDVKIAATYIKYSDYVRLSTMIETSNTSHSGLRTLSLLITAEYSAWEWYSPIITFVVILLLPSALTFITLLIHRIRASRAAQRDRAPEDVVRNLPWHIWSETGWEKHEGGTPQTDSADENRELEEIIVRSESAAHEAPLDPDDEDDVNNKPSTSHPATLDHADRPWFEAQLECAICLCDFVKGDKVRMLPCHHIFHLEEIDEWLIQRKKLCPVCKADVTQPVHLPAHPVPQNPVPTHTDIDTHASHESSPEYPTERTPLLSNRSDGPL
ncbi:putative RING finger protein C57A7.09 [Hypsizygus marmoreus]|uniref:RING-type E3 ubiquitin transferase n=1 Tax=Hypsizygus marmoreus TaxID=39966 RepID=A0A369J569_HYPMA|nr:putative RING finger protein C57A7.09 [Hypsizygus marmoreus]